MDRRNPVGEDQHDHHHDHEKRDPGEDQREAASTSDRWSGAHPLNLVTIRVSFWPPNPKLLDRQVSTGALREWLGGRLSHRQENEGHRRQMLRGQGTDTLLSLVTTD